MRRLFGLIVPAVLTCAVARPVAAQGGSVVGRVLDTAGAPLAHAMVTIEAVGARASTDEQGRYELRGVPAGTYSVRARLLGFVPQVLRVTVGEGQATQQDFALRAQPIGLAPVDVTVGSRARHTAAEELAVPVDVFPAEVLARQGTRETSQMLQQLAPSVNFPRQSVTDANDIVRPFTLRGLSPDQTLVLVNGWRRHQSAVVNTFPYGMAWGSSGVDMNAIPGGAIERIEVLRDGASAQYGSDAIAGVVNLVMREGEFSPYVNVDAGRYVTADYPDDGTTVDVNGGVGIGLGRGFVNVFGEFQQRDPTNRAWADSFLVDVNGVGDLIDPATGKILQKRNSLAQPNLHWGDGLEKDAMTFANFRMPLNAEGSSEVYAFGGYSHRVGTGNGFWRYFDSARNWPELYPQGFLPEFKPKVNDYSAAGGVRATVGGWAVDLGASYGLNRFAYDLRNTNNASLGPCLDVPCAPGADGVLGTSDDPGIPNQLAFDAGRLQRGEFGTALTLAKRLELGLPSPVNVALGAQFRRESYKIEAGETASWINGGHLAQDSATNPGNLAPAGSSVFPGFSPSDASDHNRTNVGAYVDLESNLGSQVLADIAGRFESYSDFGQRLTGKLALRYQPTRRFVLRGSASTGFRAPGLSQSFFSHTTTNFIGGQLIEIGNFPVDHRASRIFGAKPLQEETSLNLSGGFAYTPRDNLTVTVDYFHIKIDHRILLTANFADTVAQRILADSGFSNIGGVQFFTNGLDTKTDGLDLTADLRVPAGQGTLQFTAAANYVRNRITRLDPLPQILQGTATDLTSIIDVTNRLAIEEERPDWRGTLTAQYTSGRFHALGRASYYGGFSSAQPSFTDEEHYGGKTLIDAEIGFQFNQVDVSIGARNLLDTYPDQMRAEFNNNDNTFPWAAASPFGYNGRYLYTRATIQLNR
ncbi:MAG TPA: TonB-dependent receptor [Gemmatimonadales bacterium]|nr:TonB-dependent receptor [Gemmatimonadales bacterium]